MSEATLSRLWGLSGLTDMSYEEFNSVVKQTLDRRDCSNEIVFLDIKEVYSVLDLQSEHAKTLLYQKVNATRR